MPLVTIEGLDGAGKTTLATGLAQALPGALLLREPGGVAAAERVRALVKDPDLHIAPRAEALPYAAARPQLVEERLPPPPRAGGPGAALRRRHADHLRRRSLRACRRNGGDRASAPLRPLAGRPARAPVAADARHRRRAAHAPVARPARARGRRPARRPRRAALARRLLGARRPDRRQGHGLRARRRPRRDRRPPPADPGPPPPG